MGEKELQWHLGKVKLSPMIEGNVPSSDSPASCGFWHHHRVRAALVTVTGREGRKTSCTVVLTLE